jgi:hypothetical protein
MFDQSEEVGSRVGERAANIILGETFQLPENGLLNVA